MLASSPITNVSVKSAARVLDILECLAESGSREVASADMGRRLGIPKSSMHGLLAVLARRGYVERNNLSGRYRLGPRLLGLGSSYVASLSLYRVAKPVMAVIARLSCETITLDILHEGSMLTIAREEASHPFRVITRIGWPFAAYATASGKVMLAALSDEALSALCPGPSLPVFTDQTVRDVGRLRCQLQGIRERGLAHVRGELYDGVEGLAVPILDHQGEVAAALDAVMPTQRARPDHLARIERVLRAGARIISAHLGAPNSAHDVIVDPQLHLEQVWGSNGLNGERR